MPRFKHHVFVCENVRPPGHSKGCCAEKKSKEIREKFKKRIAELKLNVDIRVNSSGCLDACEFGPAIVIYPEQVWYGNVKVEDIDEIINEHLINSNVVERLLIKDPKYL